MDSNMAAALPSWQSPVEARFPPPHGPRFSRLASPTSGAWRLRPPRQGPQWIPLFHGLGDKKGMGAPPPP